MMVREELVKSSVFDFRVYNNVWIYIHQPLCLFKVFVISLLLVRVKSEKSYKLTYIGCSKLMNLWMILCEWYT